MGVENKWPGQVKAVRLWAVAIGDRVAYQEIGGGVERLRSVPLLLLHRQRAVVMRDRALAQRAVGALMQRFPEARPVLFPGGPEDGLLVDAQGLDEVLAAYGLTRPRSAPTTPNGQQLLEWARGEGAAPPPPEAQEAAQDFGLVQALIAGLARGEVDPRRGLPLLAAIASETALDFLAWALVSDDPEFQAKFGRQTQLAQKAMAHLPDEAVVPFAGRLFRSPEHFYNIRSLRACVRRLREAGAIGALESLAAGHPLERQIRRWTEE